MAQFREPQPRWGACGATIGDNVFVYRGCHSSFSGMQGFPSISNIEEFNTTSLEWVERETSGSSPPGLWKSASAATSQHLYHFGGYDGKTLTNVLSELNISSRNWRKIHPVNPTEGPMRKYGCGIISINDEMLCIACGYGYPDGRTPINSRFVKSTRYTDGKGYSNELHLFNMKTAVWSSPPTTGQGPPPCAGCSFTRVDKKKAVMFGGHQPEVEKYVADTYILNFETWHWTALLQQTSSQPWPVGRVYHTAFSLYDPDSNPPHPCLAVACGLDDNFTPLDDIWLFSVEEHCWEEVPLPESFPPRWRHTGGVVHKSQTQARAAFFGGIPNSPRKYTAWRERPCMAQTTVVDLELDLTKMRRGESTGWVAVSVKDSTAIAALKVYEEALQYGYVESQALLCLLTGVAGSGKTHVGYLMFGKKPPTLRESTPLATAPVRALSLAKVHVSEEEEEWHEVDDEEQSQMIADNLAAGVSLESKRDQPTPEQSTSDSLAVNNTDGPTVSLSSPDTTVSGTTPAHSSASETTPTSNKEPNQGLESTEVKFTSSKELAVSKPVFAMEDRLIKMISKSSSPRRLSDVKWIYLLDSGGQPEFNQILPLLLKGRPITIFVTKLNERLDHRPLIEYYEKGKPICEPYTSRLTHKEILQHSVQAIASQAHLQNEENAAATKLIVVGTHRDLEHKCSEKRADKNKQLISLLTPSLSNHLIFNGQGMTELLFAVNAKNPGPEDHKVARNLRRAILKAAASLEPQKIPIAWYLLEQALRRLAADLGRSILGQEECLPVAHRFRLSESSFVTAIDYLAQLKVILHFKHVLPNIIFTNACALLDKITELVRHIYQLRSQTGSNEVTSGRWLRFRNKGMVTVELLQEFPDHYVYEGDWFTPQHLLQLFEHLLLAVAVEDGEYFMPSILPELSTEEVVQQRRVLASSSVAPVVIYFPDEVIPTGLFCLLVASLLSRRDLSHWELLTKPIPTTPYEPECVTRNYIMFKLPGNAPGALTMIDSFTHIELHVSNTPVEVAAHVCPAIQQRVIQHVRKVANGLGYKKLHPRIGTLCNQAAAHGRLEGTTGILTFLRQLFTSQKSTIPLHPASISDAGGSPWWSCTLAPHRVYGKLTERHLIWFSTQSASTQVIGSAGTPEGLAASEDAALVEAVTQILPAELNCSPRLPEGLTTSESASLGEADTRTSTAQEHPLEVDHKHVNQTTSILHSPECEEPPHALGAQPFLRELIAFPGKKKTLNITAEVGTKYFQFGVLLLEDDTGAKVSSIEHQHHRDAERINLEILLEWLSGRGLQPVAWETLCNVLDCVGLSTLSSDIRNTKTSK